jgi:hypothetical protein
MGEGKRDCNDKDRNGAHAAVEDSEAVYKLEYQPEEESAKAVLRAWLPRSLPEVPHSEREPPPVVGEKDWLVPRH